MSFCSDPTLTAKTPVSLMCWCVPESALTPTATSGGENDVCVSQLTVAAPTSCPSWLLVVSTYMPYGIIRSAVFFAASSMSVLLCS